MDITSVVIIDDLYTNNAYCFFLIRIVEQDEDDVNINGNESEQTFTKERKKRKRKRLTDSLENNVSQMDIKSNCDTAKHNEKEVNILISDISNVRRNESDQTSSEEGGKRNKKQLKDSLGNVSHENIKSHCETPKHIKSLIKVSKEQGVDRAYREIELNSCNNSKLLISNNDGLLEVNEKSCVQKIIEKPFHDLNVSGSEQTFTKERKKRKRNGLKHYLENYDNQMEVESHFENAKCTEKEHTLISVPNQHTEYVNTSELWKSYDVHHEDSLEFNKISCVPENVSESFQKESGEEVILSNDVECPKKRRKRVRKHKKRTPVSENHHVLQPTYKKNVCASVVDVSCTHIRFDKEEKVVPITSDEIEKESGNKINGENDSDKIDELLNSANGDEDLIVSDSHNPERKTVFGKVTKWDLKTSPNKHLANGFQNTETHFEIPDSNETFAKLLSLQKSSTPLVFERKRNDDNISQQSLPVENENIKNLDFSKQPKLENIPRTEDIIAFKVSGVIFAIVVFTRLKL